MGDGDGVLDRRCFHLQSQLSQAAYDGNVKKIKTLLRRGANADSYAGDRFPPLFGAALKGKTAAARILLDNGANIDRKYPLYGSPLYAAIYGNHVESVELLLARGADANLPNGDDTPLKIARANGYDAILVLLKKAGAKE
jgi:ankyrin repeat protein